MSLLVKRGDSPQDRFAAEVLEVFRSDIRVEDAWYDREQFAISARPVAGAPVWIGLADLYQRWGAADPSSRAGPIGEFVDAAVAPPELPATWEAARPLLRPVLCGVSAGLPADRRPESGALWRHSLPYLAELVELDLPGGPPVSGVLAEQWNVPAQDVFAVARQNLVHRLSRPQPSGPAGPRVLRLVDDGGAHWVSHLLVDGWLAEFSGHLRGRPVAFAPDRATLLVAPDEPGLLRSVFEMVEEEYDQSPRPVSPAAYTVDDAGRITPYRAPPAHPLYVAAGRAERVLANAEYGRQKRWLDDHPASSHRAGSVMLSGRADGSIFSVAITGRGATLLPRTDYVALTLDDRDMTFVPWDDAERILGLKPEPGLEPHRFLLAEELPAPAVEALRASATDL